MNENSFNNEYRPQGGTDAGAIGVQAIGSRGLTLLCPKCKAVLTEFKALSRFERTLNGEVWYECQECNEYEFKFCKESVSDMEKPLEYQMPVKPLENSAVKNEQTEVEE